ncbi:GWT1 [Trinorchestia longiramus]|nr:GWT1 [Trinorchestia longiramus]
MEAGSSERLSVRAAHEQHITGHSGCQWYEVLLVLYPVYPALVILSTLLRNVGTPGSQLRAAVEVLVCVLSVVTSQTVAHNHLVPLAVGLTLIAALGALAGRKKRDAVSFRSQGAVQVVQNKERDTLTLLRAFVGLSTAVAILAVDFHVFPRRFAKTEEFGWSVMDVGAAAYLFINATVDQRYTAGRSLRVVAREAGVLFVLGTVRVMSLSAADYQQHASEYGLHSNFFFVLAFTKLVSVRWCKSVGAAGAATAGCVMTVVQHLSSTRLQSWVLSNAPRNSFLSSNRESVVGAPGYVALYCWGAVLGKILLATKRDRSSSAAEYLHGPRLLAFMSAVAAAVAAFVLWYVLSVMQVQPSRRLVNAPFIIWMVFLLLLFTCLASCVEVCLKSINPRADVIPRPLRAINSHQLLFFLASNLLTGVCNLSIDTLAVRAPWDVLIIVTYAIVLCYGAMLLPNASGNRKTRHNH